MSWNSLNIDSQADSRELLPNLCAKEFGAVLDGSPRTNVDKGMESWRQRHREQTLIITFLGWIYVRCEEEIINKLNVVTQ